MIELGKTKLKDILDKMSTEDIGQMVKFEAACDKWGTEKDVIERLFGSDNDFEVIKGYSDAILSYGPKQLNGYDIYHSNQIDGVVILKDGKLVCIIDEYEMCNVIHFEGAVIVPGRDTMTMFSTITGVKQVEYIR